jgi:hypothetical protein
LSSFLLNLSLKSLQLMTAVETPHNSEYFFSLALKCGAACM